MSLEITALRKEFPQGTGAGPITVLHDVGLRLESGTVAAVLGQSGSGKSTLLSLLAALDQPTAGSITLNGVNVGSLSPRDLALWRGQNVGIVFQHYHLLPHLTARENVELPLEILGRDPGDLAAQLLGELGLSHRLDHFPRQMSGGECQRVAIARALAPGPKLLLADEPSGSLDADTGDKVMDAFFRAVRGHRTTTILVTHNRELAERCDQRFHLDHGRLQQL